MLFSFCTCLNNTSNIYYKLGNATVQIKCHLMHSYININCEIVKNISFKIKKMSTCLFISFSICAVRHKRIANTEKVWELRISFSYIILSGYICPLRFNYDEDLGKYVLLAGQN